MMMMLESSGAIWRPAAEATLNGVLPGMMLAAFVGVLLRIWRGANASTRFLVWWLTLAGIILLPAIPRNWPALAPAFEARPPAQQPSVLILESTTADPAPIAAAPVPHQDLPPARRVSLFPLRLPSGLWRAFGLGWLAICAILLARLVWSQMYIQGLRRRAVPFESGTGEGAQVLVSDEIAAPMAIGFVRPAILLPRSVPTRLAGSELAQVLLHERAHIRRGDPWTNLAQKIVEALFFFHPAVWWIGRELCLEREIACDDSVLAATGAARPYATCLTKLCELRLAARGPLLSTAATGSRRQLSWRIETLLDAHRNRSLGLSRPVLIAVSVMLLFAAAGVGCFPGWLSLQDTFEQIAEPLPPVEPAPVAVPAPMESGAAPAPAAPVMLAQAREYLRRDSDDDHQVMMHYSNALSSFEVRMRGRVEFTDDDRDVKSVSPGGSLVISERRGLTYRKLEFRPGASGSVERRYSENGSSQSYEPEGRKWAQELLLRVIRETGIGAPERVERILRQRGPEAVLDEISHIESNGSKRIYFSELLSRNHSQPILLRAAPQIAREIQSDGEKANLLRQTAAFYRGSEELRSAYFRAVNSIHSDGEHRRVLDGALNAGTPTRDDLGRMLQSAARINSDGEKAQFLVNAAPFYTEDEAVRTEFFHAAGTINSDGERRRALTALLRRGTPGKETLVRICRSAAHINSDGEKAQLLVDLSNQFGGDPAVRGAVIETANTIHSDGEHRRALTALLRSGNDRDTLAGLLRSAGMINSDGEKAQLLVDSAPRLPPDEAVRKAFLTAADGIHSDGEKRRALTALLKRDPRRETLLPLITSATRINSDGEKAQLLVDVSRAAPEDAAVRSAVIDAAHTIRSDGEYRRVVDPLLRKGSTTPDGRKIRYTRHKARNAPAGALAASARSSTSAAWPR